MYQAPSAPIVIFFLNSLYNRNSISQEVVSARRGAACQERVGRSWKNTTGSSSTSPPLPRGREAVGIPCQAQKLQALQAMALL